MLKKDLITKNIEVLVDMAMKSLGLYLDNPDEALQIVDQYVSPELLEKLLHKDTGITAENPLLVKAHVDLFYVKALAHFELEQDKSLLEESKTLMENFIGIFPANFPFDYYQKIQHLKNKIAQ